MGLEKEVEAKRQRLEEVFQWLRQAGLKLKPARCKLLQHRVRYLGHIVSSRRVATDPSKGKMVEYGHCKGSWCHYSTCAGVSGFGNTYIFDTDTSGCGVGAVLSQQHRAQEQVIVYYIKTLTPQSKITA
ncbi:uncharacterized protein [Watersipora subatra]|uniref:uncharacterized protein n=1 Tax=Watersipora subatra TaxID=2589382 RepID=UPI00355B89BF